MIQGKYKSIACNVFVYLTNSLGSSRTSPIQKMVLFTEVTLHSTLLLTFGPKLFFFISSTSLEVLFHFQNLTEAWLTLSRKQWRSSPQHMKPAQKLCWWPNFFHSDWKIIDDRNCSEVKIARTPMSESLWDWEEKSVEVLARGWFWCNWDVADSLFSSNTHSSRSSPTNWASSKTVVTFSHRRILVQILTPIQTWLEPCKKSHGSNACLARVKQAPSPCIYGHFKFQTTTFRAYHGAKCHSWQ